MKEDPDKPIPTIATGIDANGTVIFEEHIGTIRPTETDNASRTHNTMDDILLSHLDTPYSEDCEKLKRIANEVAETYHQYCQISDATGENIYSISPAQIGKQSFQFWLNG